MVSDEQVVSRLRELLVDADIETTTERQLRKKLEAEFGVDLSDRKGVLREEVERYLATQPGGADEDGAADSAGGEPGAAGHGDDADDAADTSRRRGKRSGFGSRLSAEMAAFLGVDAMSRTEVVKQLWVYIKEHELQNPKDKRKIVLDDALGRLFKPPLNMFNMNKQLSRHVYVEDRDDADDEDGDAAATPKPKRAAASGDSGTKPRKKRRESADGTPAKPNGFTRELNVTPELSAWLERKTVSRPELTRRFWAYIKDRGLQNPANKQEVLADDALAALTGERRFKAFGFMKLFSRHLLGPADA